MNRASPGRASFVFACHTERAGLVASAGGGEEPLRGADSDVKVFGEHGAEPVNVLSGRFGLDEERDGGVEAGVVGVGVGFAGSDWSGRVAGGGS
jgi:hypothetical protein